jgi:hypothetical protein
MASLLETWRAKLHLDPRTPHLQLPRAIALIKQTSTGLLKIQVFLSTLPEDYGNITAI